MYGHLTQFWQLTDTTGEEIGNFLQGIDRMMDSVITRNELTLRNLRRLAHASPPTIGAQVWAVLVHAPLTIDDAVRRQYIEHLDRLTGDIDVLILKSHLVELNLKDMSNIQWDLHDLINGDNSDIKHKEKAVQGSFWAWFGGHQNLLEDYKQQAAVLKGLDGQRTWAVDLVGEITQTLKSLRRELNDLRIRIQEPGFDITGDLEFQIKVIQQGVDALKQGRVTSKRKNQETMSDVKRQIEARLNKG